MEIVGTLRTSLFVLWVHRFTLFVLCMWDRLRGEREKSHQSTTVSSIRRYTWSNMHQDFLITISLWAEQNESVKQGKKEKTEWGTINSIISEQKNKCTRWLLSYELATRIYPVNNCVCSTIITTTDLFIVFLYHLFLVNIRHQLTPHWPYISSLLQSLWDGLTQVWHFPLVCHHYLGTVRP